jgi:hypothetical protein
MNNFSSPYRRLLFILIWVLIICFGAHLLHDLHPGHIDLDGTGALSGVCHLAIHAGVLAGMAPHVALAIPILFVISLQRLFHSLDPRSVPIPPPILT